MIVSQTATDSPTISAYVEGEGSGYTVTVSLLEPEDIPEIERAGYTSRSVIYTVFADRPYADHDRHRIVRRLPGSNGWLLDDLADLKADLLETNR